MLNYQSLLSFVVGIFLISNSAFCMKQLKQVSEIDIFKNKRENVIKKIQKGEDIVLEFAKKPQDNFEEMFGLLTQRLTSMNDFLTGSQLPEDIEKVYDNWATLIIIKGTWNNAPSWLLIRAYHSNTSWYKKFYGALNNIDDTFYNLQEKEYPLFEQPQKINRENFASIYDNIVVQKLYSLSENSNNN